MQGVRKNILLLLALYREITLANASFQRQNVTEEVSRVSALVQVVVLFISVRQTRCSFTRV